MPGMHEIPKKMKFPRTVFFAAPDGQRSCHHERYFADRSGAFQELVLQLLLVV